MLDYVRPDLLRLRVLARSLIMWDEVLPTTEWVLNQVYCDKLVLLDMSTNFSCFDVQIPIMVRDAWKLLGARAVSSSSTFSVMNADEDDDDDDIDSFFDVSDIADFCDIPPPPPIVDASPSKQSQMKQKAALKVVDDALEGVDLVAVKQAHANCIAGALLGVAMRYAGTSDEGAKQTLLFFARHFKVMTILPLYMM